jgi:hypothetical protein
MFSFPLKVTDGEIFDRLDFHDFAKLKVNLSLKLG